MAYCNDNNLNIFEIFENIINNFNSYSSVPYVDKSMNKSMKYGDFIKYYEGTYWLKNNYDFSGIKGNNCQDFVEKAVEILKV